MNCETWQHFLNRAERPSELVVMTIRPAGFQVALQRLVYHFRVSHYLIPNALAMFLDILAMTAP
ncbi:hypothetical protein ABZ532_28320 [Streptomyces sp. NPDC019396]|uniref:hypothetical protein n=1 Tax=Streptomyces sp. NPDC019396 TaxID=3154687 RepID=UPI0033D76CA6